MKAKITYIDKTAISPEELIMQIKQEYGQLATVEILPDSKDPFHLIYFAVQELITSRQLDSFYDDGPLYPTKLRDLMAEAEELCKAAIVQVVHDNETRVT